jgi:predicted nuclease with TOPRIM domain
MSELWVAIIVAFVAALPGILAFLNQHHKNNMDAEDRFNARVMTYTEKLEGRLQTLETANEEKGEEIEQLKRENEQLRKENAELRAMVEQLKKRVQELTTPRRAGRQKANL